MKKSSKRGQVTIYIIIGIVILIVVGLFFFFRQVEEPGFTEQVTLDSVKVNVQTFVQSCIKDETEEALLGLGYQGGYLFTPDFGSLDYEGYSVPYDYFIGYNMLPSIPNVEQLQMNDYLETAFDICIADLDFFKDYADIETGLITVNTTVNFDSVIVTVDYPVKIIVGDSAVELKEFTQMFDVRLGKILGVADDLINRIVDEPNWLDITYLNEFDVRIQQTPMTDTESLYFITDSESILRQRPYVFVFAVKHTDNKPPYIYPISDFTVSKGHRVQYFVDAVDFDGDNITFTSFTDMPDFSIDSVNGEMDFVAAAPGLYLVTVAATDDLGYSDEESFLVDVE